MKNTVYLLFVTLFFKNFFPANVKILPRFVNYTVDLFAIVVALAIVLKLVTMRRLTIDFKYFYLVVLYLAIIAVGVLSNLVRVEPLIVGMRFHLKYLPFFLLPMIYEFSGEDVRRQLCFLLGLLFLQLPMVVLQKFVIYRGFHSDYITGTLGVSSHLSMVLICSLAVVFAFYLKRKMSLKRFLQISLWLFLPMTMNETKSTVILLPIAIALPAYFLPRVWASSKFKNMITVGVVIGIFLVTFAAVFQQSEGYSVFDHYEKELAGRGYFYTDSEGKIGQKKIGRGDAIVMALKDQAKDLGNLIFGLGAGNVIASGSESMAGDYVAGKMRYHPEMVTVTHQLWELGLAGLITYIMTICFLFRDARFLAKSNDVFGVLALGWTGVVTIISISLIYKNIIYLDALYILFWYFSGLIADRVRRLRGLGQLYAVHGHHVFGVSAGGYSEVVSRPAGLGRAGDWIEPR